MAQSSISSSSATYKSDGTTIDVAVDTVIDLGKTLSDSSSLADFHSASIPARWRAIAEYYAGLTEAERKLQMQNWPGGANIDSGSLAFIDYVNSELYNIVRGLGVGAFTGAATTSYETP